MDKDLRLAVLFNYKNPKKDSEFLVYRLPSGEWLYKDNYGYNTVSDFEYVLESLQNYLEDWFVRAPEIWCSFFTYLCSQYS